MKMQESSKDIGHERIRPFLCGVCEGFYGKPWTLAQRLVLFERHCIKLSVHHASRKLRSGWFLTSALGMVRRMQRFGMNTYLYAPKDDYKHRLEWRELYTEQEMGDLKQLIGAADKCHINFVYALSPGLDMVYSSISDMDALKAKLGQVKSMGCKQFALLFDDIDDELCLEDKIHFSSPAHAQSSLTNVIYDHLQEPDIFLFCPTGEIMLANLFSVYHVVCEEYSTNRTEPDLASSSYLKTIGEKLHPKIDILWTGPKVVSQHITMEGIEAISGIVKRNVTIWDNLHANDYDQTRLYLGPYSGRDSLLTTKLRGVLTNPNLEFEMNFIAIHTLAQWSQNKCTRFIPLNAVADHRGELAAGSSAKMDVDLEAGQASDRDWSPSASDEMDSDQVNGGSQYNERRALRMAVMDWLPELYKTKTSSGQARRRVKVGQSVCAGTNNEDPSRPNEEDTKNMSVGNQSMSQTDVSTCGTDDASVTKTNATNPDIVPASLIEAGSASTNDVSQSQTEVGCDGSLVAKSCRNEDRCDMLTVDDVLLICHLFYLPYEHGSRANLLLQTASWLLSHIPSVISKQESVSNRNSSSSDESEEMAYEWYHRAGQFHHLNREIAMVVDKLVNIPNREILYEIYAYITDMRSTLALVNSYIKWHGTEKKNKDSQFKSGDQEPWVYRGGLLGEFRTLLPVDSRLTAKTIISGCNTPKLTQRPYIVRPYFPTDKAGVYKVCESTFSSIQRPSCVHYPQLLSDWYVGGLLEFASSQSYVVEDFDSCICGYIVSCSDVKQYNSYLSESWIPMLRTRYPLTNTDNNEQDLVNILHNSLEFAPNELISLHPSMFTVALVPAFNTASVVERLVRCACLTMASHKSRGVFASLPPGSDIDMLLLRTSLGFNNISSSSTSWSLLSDGWKVIGKQFTDESS